MFYLERIKLNLMFYRNICIICYITCYLFVITLFKLLNKCQQPFFIKYLLPKTHAGGGMADIVYKYIGNEIYPTHTVLIEATLSEKVGQRSMEIEPVTRHLGEYLANIFSDNSIQNIFKIIFSFYISKIFKLNTFYHFFNSFSQI